MKTLGQVADDAESRWTIDYNYSFSDRTISLRYTRMEYVAKAVVGTVRRRLKLATKNKGRKLGRGKG